MRFVVIIMWVAVAVALLLAATGLFRARDVH